jgi:coronin-7
LRSPVDQNTFQHSSPEKSIEAQSPVRSEQPVLRQKGSSEPAYQSPSATAKRESTASKFAGKQIHFASMLVHNLGNFTAVRQSKFRHLEGTPLHKSLHIDNLRNLSKNVPGESDAFHANKKFAAVPLGGSGGLIAIIKVSISCSVQCT